MINNGLMRANDGPARAWIMYEFYHLNLARCFSATTDFKMVSAVPGLKVANYYYTTTT